MQEEKRGKEVKQFVKLSCQPLHGGIRPTAKMNILFLMQERALFFFLQKPQKEETSDTYRIFLQNS